MGIESKNDYILQQDIEKLAKSDIPWEFFRNSSFLITGATGMIGSQIVKALLCRNRLYGTNIKIFALARSHEKAETVFAGLSDREQLQILYGDVNRPIDFGEHVDFIIHAASLSSSKDFAFRPVETIKTTMHGTENMLEFAMRCSARCVLFLSTLEIYGVPQTSGSAITEKDLGFIDNLLPRSSYSEGKRMAECMCMSYATEYDVPVRIARLCQTFGAGVDYNDGRVYAHFARSVLEGKDIVLYTKGETARDYCYTTDAIASMLFIIARGKN